jgi:hypothetical protein
LGKQRLSNSDSHLCFCLVLYPPQSVLIGHVGGHVCRTTPASLISSAACPIASSLRALNTTRAPCRAAILAVVRPMPLDAPVMTITCSSSGFKYTFIVSFEYILLDFLKTVFALKQQIDMPGSF